jgi:hypothetical protein
MGLDAMLKEPVWHALPRMAYLSSLGVIRVVRKSIQHAAAKYELRGLSCYRVVMYLGKYV